MLSRLIHADLYNADHARGVTFEKFPRKLYGSHSLKAWGYRLGVLKGDYADNTDWSEWTQEMQDYCQQDVAVTARLWQHLEPHKWSKQSIKLEHSLAEVCHRIGEAGWTFDEKKAAKVSTPSWRRNERICSRSWTSCSRRGSSKRSSSPRSTTASSATPRASRS